MSTSVNSDKKITVAAETLNIYGRVYQLLQILKRTLFVTLSGNRSDIQGYGQRSRKANAYLSTKPSPLM